MTEKKSFFTRVAHLSFAIFLNKPIGLLRDILRARYMGVGVLSDAFSTAWRIPNSFRRIFGEGALNALLVPELLKMKNDKAISAFASFSLIVFQIFVAIACCLLSYYAESVLSFIAPGSVDRVLCAVPLLRVLIFFILSMSGSVILGCALQTKHIFSIGPVSQFVINIALCIEFYFCNKYSISLYALAWMLIFNGFIIWFIHFYSYKKNGFTFLWPSRDIFLQGFSFIKRCIPAFFGAAIVEVNLFIDQAIASYLTAGSQTLFEYVSTFIRLPLQVFGSSFATVSATQFAEIALRNNKRLLFFIFESCKLMFYLSLFAMMGAFVFSYKIFYTLLFSEKFALIHVEKAALLLRLFSPYIFFATVNKILVNAYYAVQETVLPTVFSVFCAVLNSFMTWIGMKYFGLPGIVVGTVLVEIVRTMLHIVYLPKVVSLHFPLRRWCIFCAKIIVQFFAIALIVLPLYGVLQFFIVMYVPSYSYYLFDTIFYWFWIGPLVCLYAYMLFKTRGFFGIKLYYIK